METRRNFSAGLVFISDRGGHLNNALMLMEQMGLQPGAFITSHGPEVEWLKKLPALAQSKVFAIPLFFSWIGATRHFNPFKFVHQLLLALVLCLRLRPKVVISLGASDVVPFCYLARAMGAKIYHVECMNQVIRSSMTGRLLYPICTSVYVQWEELLASYGPKASYQGWVL